MKTSFYTYQKAYDDKLLMYNCRTDSLIVLNKDLCLLWNQYKDDKLEQLENCLLYTSPSPRDYA